MFADITLIVVMQWLLVLARVGALFTMLPGIGDNAVSPIMRVWLAVGFSMLVVPIVAHSLPSAPPPMLGVLWLLIREIIVGFFLGMSVRILISVMHSVGLLISTQMGLGSAMLFDPSQQTQGTEIGVLLTMLAVVMMFQMNIHHLWLRGLVESYELIPPGVGLPVADFSTYISDSVNRSFILAISLSAPSVIIGMMIAILGGVLARLMPQLNVFFVSLPVQIWLGALVLMMVISSMMFWYLDVLQSGAGFLSEGF